MNFLNRLNTFTDRNRDLVVEVIRIYLGLALFAKGVYFASHVGVVMGFLNDDYFPSVVLAHLIALAHLTGGVLLALGLLTRIAAAVQVPILLGAIFTVHLREGLFGPSQTLELALLVFTLLVLFVIVGGGRWSTDRFLARREALLTGHEPPGLSGTA